MIDFNKNLFFRINKLSCQFEDKNLESEYQDFRWERMRNYVRNLLIISEIFNMLIRVDDIRLLGPSPVYIGFHVLGFAAWVYFLFFLSDNNKKKWHQTYFTIWIIGMMNMGAWSYYFTNPQAFPVAAGALPILMILWLYVWPYFFLNSILVTISATVPFCILTLEQGSMAIEQIPYLFLMPLIFLSYVKWSKEKSERVDFIKTKKLEANHNLMNNTFRDILARPKRENTKDDGVLAGENTRVTAFYRYHIVFNHHGAHVPETAVKFLNRYFTSMHDVIEEYGGHIVSYIGDSVMVVFGAPKKVEDHELQAVRCAIGMRDKLKEMNKKWDENEFSRYWKNNDINEIQAVQEFTLKRYCETLGVRGCAV